jgi:hypothetical protein
MCSPEKEVVRARSSFLLQPRFPFGKVLVLGIEGNVHKAVPMRLNEHVYGQPDDSSNGTALVFTGK